MAKATGDPYLVDYAYAEAIMKERHSAASGVEKLEAYLEAASLGTPRLPWGLEAHASFLFWDRGDRERGKEVCRLGMELFPDDRAAFSLLLAQRAYRDQEYSASVDLFTAVARMETNSLERDRMVLGLGLFFLASGPEKLSRQRDEWAELLPESAAIPYLGALAQYLKDGTNAYMRGQEENYSRWKLQSAGDPRQALLYEWLARAGGKL